MATAEQAPRGGAGRRPLIAAAAVVLIGSLVAIGGIRVPGAPAKMQSVVIAKKVCKTTGGGRFVRIKQFPGEKIDRRLRRDIKFLMRKYNIYITDGHSLDPAHSANGEHPIGLALDIVPNFSKGGSWNDIDRLAKWAERKQNQPRAPFRWVGYNGDAGHGRGHHLHLSYSHSTTRYNKPARTIYSIRCPNKRNSTPDPAGESGGDGTGGGGSGGGSKGGTSKDKSSGGVSASKGQKAGSDKGNTNGGVSSRSRSMGPVAPAQPETDGADA